MTKVKVCGVTNENDANLAIKAGADYIGLIFASSKRKIIRETAKRIIDNASDGFCNFVGVFMDGKKKEIEETCNYAGIKIIQFHGDETPAFCNYFVNRNFQVIKVIRVMDSTSLKNVSLYEKVEFFLFDTYSHIQKGGTGRVFDWNILKNNDFLSEKNIFVSGGLDSTNVEKAISLLNPYGVDASSCLEKNTGYKDKGKLVDFIRKAHEVG